MANGYTKLFSDIVTSTIWTEPNDCRVLWISMLALKDEVNICRATVPALAKMCDLTIEQCEAYLEKFQQPDKHSRSQDWDGRRIERVEGGWLILNGQKYRDLLRGEERREYVRRKVAEHRARQYGSIPTPAGRSTYPRVNKSKHGNQCKPIAEAEEGGEVAAPHSGRKRPTQPSKPSKGKILSPAANVTPPSGLAGSENTPTTAP